MRTAAKQQKIQATQGARSKSEEMPFDFTKTNVFGVKKSRLVLHSLHA